MCAAQPHDQIVWCPTRLLGLPSTESSLFLYRDCGWRPRSSGQYYTRADGINHGRHDATSGKARRCRDSLGNLGTLAVDALVAAGNCLCCFEGTAVQNIVPNLYTQQRKRTHGCVPCATFQAALHHGKQPNMCVEKKAFAQLKPGRSSLDIRSTGSPRKLGGCHWTAAHTSEAQPDDRSLANAPPSGARLLDGR